jgi:hypothetical protein
MSELRADTITASNGTSPVTLTKQSAAKAWVNFNGTGTVAINGSFSIASLTDNGTGDYQINFSSATSDAFYSAVSSSQQTSSEASYVTWSCRTSGLTTARCKVSGVRENSTAGGAVDVFQVRTTVNGDLA